MTDGYLLEVHIFADRGVDLFRFLPAGELHPPLRVWRDASRASEFMLSKNSLARLRARDTAMAALMMYHTTMPSSSANRNDIYFRRELMALTM